VLCCNVDEGSEFSNEIEFGDSKFDNLKKKKINYNLCEHFCREKCARKKFNFEFPWKFRLKRIQIVEKENSPFEESAIKQFQFFLNNCQLPLTEMLFTLSIMFSKHIQGAKTSDRGKK
jgi:hypothetical protein